MQFSLSLHLMFCGFIRDRNTGFDLPARNALFQVITTSFKASGLSNETSESTDVFIH